MLRVLMGALAILVLSGYPARAQSQKFEVGGMLGWQFGAMMDETTKEEQEDSTGKAISVDSLGEAIGLPPSAVYELFFRYHITRTLHLQLSFSQQPTELNFDDRAADTTTILTNVRATYYMVGLVYNWSKTNRKPFVGFSIGHTSWRTNEPYESESGFAMAPIMGYQSWMSQSFGFELKATVLITNRPAGNLFRNKSTDWSYHHAKNTWSTQFQLGVAIMFGR
jgi:hypothetical protein